MNNVPIMNFLLKFRRASLELVANPDWRKLFSSERESRALERTQEDRRNRIHFQLVLPVTKLIGRIFHSMAFSIFGGAKASPRGICELGTQNAPSYPWVTAAVVQLKPGGVATCSDRNDESWREHSSVLTEYNPTVRTVRGWILS